MVLVKAVNLTTTLFPFETTDDVVFVITYSKLEGYLFQGFAESFAGYAPHMPFEPGQVSPAVGKVVGDGLFKLNVFLFYPAGKRRSGFSLH